jgi:hypothetical protein
MHEFEIRCEMRIARKNIVSAGKKGFLIGIVLQMIAFALPAQSPAPIQGWWQIFLKHKTEKGWFWEADGGFRVHSTHFEPNAALARIGFGRQFKHVSVGAGVAWFETWPKAQNKPGNAEFRMHQKFTVPQKLGPVSLSHILRAEERWFQQSTLRNEFHFQLRLRYQLQANYTLQKLPLLKAKPYFNGHSEIFASPNEGPFNQFRLYGGIGLNWKEQYRFEMGYLAIWLRSTVTGQIQPAQVLRMNLFIQL